MSGHTTLACTYCTILKETHIGSLIVVEFRTMGHESRCTRKQTHEHGCMRKPHQHVAGAERNPVFEACERTEKASCLKVCHDGCLTLLVKHGFASDV